MKTLANLSNIQVFLILCGIILLMLCITVICVLGYFAILDVIETIIRAYTIKHRFDKPPTAKCYCKDCTRHDDNGKCYKFEGYYTADNWFCWDADPKK